MWLCEKSTNSLFLRLALTFKHEKLFKPSASKINFIFLCFEFMQLTKSLKYYLDLNRTKMSST